MSLWRLPSVSLRGALRVWARDWMLYRRAWKGAMLGNFFQPLLYLLSLGFGLGLYVGDRLLGVDYAVFIAPGLAAAAAMNGAVFEVTYNLFLKLRHQRLYDAVITTPIEPEDVAVGELLWAVTRASLYGVAFLVVMLVLGYIRSVAAVLAPIGIVLVGLAFALLGMGFSFLIRSIDSFTYFFTLFITPLFLFSGIFFPVSDLPALVRPLAWFTPLHHGVELLRALTLTGDVAAAGLHASWLVVFSALLLPPAVNLLRRRLVV